MGKKIKKIEKKILFQNSHYKVMLFQFPIEPIKIIKEKKYEWKIKPTPKILKEVKTKNGKC